MYGAMNKPTKRGRPPKPDADRFDLVHIRLPKPMIREIDELCASRRDQPDRSKAIRELIAKGLEA